LRGIDVDKNTATISTSAALEIAEILQRRANEIAHFYGDYTKAATCLGSVEMALNREISRLRALADEFKVNEKTGD
jgi:hypothetical protein